MKTIKLFLASSIQEFKSERQELKAFIGRLNDIYVHRGIYFEFLLGENLSNAIQKYGSQDMYNNKIRECNYFYMLVGKKLGEYTYQEFEVALSEFNKKNLPHIYVYFKHGESDIKFSDSVLQFMETLDKKLKYYYSHFCIASIGVRPVRPAKGTSPSRRKSCTKRE